MAHMSRREYRMKKEHAQAQTERAHYNYSRSRADSREQFRQENEAASRPKINQVKPAAGREKVQIRLNFWQIFSDRPYVSVFIIILAIFFLMAKLWLGLLVLVILVAIGIFVIGHSHHPNRVLSLEFKMKASRKLSMLRALQLGGSVLMFLATYMRQVISVNFSSAGSTDSLQVVEGLLSSRGGSYGQQGSYFLNLLNTLTGGQLLGTYRYATNSAQMMNSSSGRMIVMWTLLLMLAPAFCVLAQFFKEPQSRNATLVTSLIAMITFILTPVLMRRWVVSYAMERQMPPAAANSAVTVGPMAYVAIACSVLVALIAFYRYVKKDQF